MKVPSTYIYIYIYDWGAFPTHGDFLLSLFDLPFRAADWSRYEITKASGGGRRSDEKDEAMMRRHDEKDEFIIITRSPRGV